MVKRSVIARGAGIAMLAIGTFPTGLAAQETAARSVSANDIAGLHELLLNAGYDAELEIDEEPGGTMIKIDVNGAESFVQLSDCDDAVPDFCDTFVLSTAWNRETPMPAERVAEANRAFRYVSVWLDDEGDPFVQWAILTRREGIPATVFLNALQRYLGIVDDFSDFVFDDDEADASSEANLETAD